MDEQTVYAVSALIAALSFAVLCVFVIRTLMSARKTLDSLQVSIGEASGTVEAIRGKVEELAGNVNEISINVKEKLHAADALFEAAKDAGATLKETTHTAKEITGTLSRAVREQAAATAKPWMEWMTAGARIVGAIRHAVSAGASDARPRTASRAGS